MSYICLIHHNQRAATLTEQLAAGLGEIGQRHLDDTSLASVDWNLVAPGFMFTEGKASTTSIVVRDVPADLDRDRREDLMTAIRDLWTDTVGCTVDEIVISLNPTI